MDGDKARDAAIGQETIALTDWFDGSRDSAEARKYGMTEWTLGKNDLSPGD